MRNVFRGSGGFSLVVGFITMVGANELLGFSLILIGGLILYLSIPQKPKG